MTDSQIEPDIKERERERERVCVCVCARACGGGGGARAGTREAVIIMTLKLRGTGVLVMMQWKGIQLETMRTWVRCLALLSGLRIQHCREMRCRSQTRLGSGVAVALAQASSCSSD